MQSTSATLMGQLRDLSDPRAWATFERRYRSRILAWCREKGLQEADAENVTQEVLLRVAKMMRTFIYKPGDNFSGLLRVIWRHAWIDFVRSKVHSPVGQFDESLSSTLSELADDELSRHLEKEFEREELHEAMARAQRIISTRDWELFQQVDLGGKRTAEVAEERGMTMAAVGMAVKRARDKVKQALLELRG